MIIYGKQLFLHLLEKHKEKLINIYLAKDIEKDIFNKIVKSGVKIHKVDNKKAQALARGGNHQGFLAEVCEFEFASLNEIKKTRLLSRAIWIKRRRKYRKHSSHDLRSWRRRCYNDI